MSQPSQPLLYRLFLLATLVVSGFCPIGAEEPTPKDESLPRFHGERDLAQWRILADHDFERHGKVLVKDGELLLEQGRPATGIAWKGELPRTDYEVSLEAKRVVGDDFFCGLTFPVDKSHCTLILGGWGGSVTGLSNIDNFAAVENETTGFTEFKNDRWYRVRLRVTAEKIQAWVDDQSIVNVETKDKKFSVWWEQEPVRPLGIATWNTTAAIRKLQVKRVK